MYGKLNVSHRGSLFAALGLAALLVAPSVAQAGLKTVEATGQGYNKRNALNNAFRNAIEQAGGVKISSMSTMENYQLVMDTVVATATGVVKSYDVVKEDGKRCESEANCSVTIKAQVSDENLFDSFEAARLLFEQKGKPSVLVMLAEQNAGSQQAAQWWEGGNKSISLDITENALIKRWKPYGFRFVDRQALMGKFRAGNPSDSEVKEVAADAGADIVIIGKAVATQNDTKGSVFEGTPMKPVNAQLSIRILYVDTGEIIASTNGFGGYVHSNGDVSGKVALERALNSAADEIFKGVMKTWQAETTGAQRLEVTASGFKKSKDFRKFMKVINDKIDAVQSVNQRGYKKGSAKFEVMFLGSAFDFGEALESQKFPGFGIELDEVTGNTLTFTVTK